MTDEQLREMDEAIEGMAYEAQLDAQIAAYDADIAAALEEAKELRELEEMLHSGPSSRRPSTPPRSAGSSPPRSADSSPTRSAAGSSPPRSAEQDEPVGKRGEGRGEGLRGEIRCGEQSTMGLRKLDDGSTDSMAQQRRRQKAEDSKAIYGSWDSSPYVPTVPKPIVVKEPTGSSAEPSTSSEPDPSVHEERVVRTMKPKHQAMIEQMMKVYREETGVFQAKSVRDPMTGRMATIRPSGTGRAMEIERRLDSPNKGGGGSRPRSSPQEEARKARQVVDIEQVAMAEELARTGPRQTPILQQAVTATTS